MRSPRRSRSPPPHARTSPGSTGRTSGNRRTDSLEIVPPGKNRSVRRTAPSLKLRAASVSPRSPTSTSVEPPPMSTRMSRWSKTGTACSTPRWMSLASSSPEITSMSTFASRRARVRNTSALSRLAHRAGGDGADRCAVRCGDALHAAQRRDAAVHGVGRELLHVAAAVAEADRLLLASDDLEAVVEQSGDDEMEAVGADVERGQGGDRTRTLSSRRDAVLAGLHAAEHAGSERVDLLEGAAVDVGVAALVAVHDRGDDRFVEIARRQVQGPAIGLRRQIVVDPCAGEAIIEQGSCSSRSACCRAAPARFRCSPARSGIRPTCRRAADRRSSSRRIAGRRRSCCWRRSSSMLFLNVRCCRRRRRSVGRCRTENSFSVGGSQREVAGRELRRPDTGSRSSGSSVTTSAGPSVGSGLGSMRGRLPPFGSSGSNGMLMSWFSRPSVKKVLQRCGPPLNPS